MFCATSVLLEGMKMNQTQIRHSVYHLKWQNMLPSNTKKTKTTNSPQLNQVTKTFFFLFETKFTFITGLFFIYFFVVFKILFAFRPIEIQKNISSL